MPGNTSFYYAIFKRLQGAYYLGFSTPNAGHMDPNTPMGGFSLRTPHDLHGLFGTIGSNPTMSWLQGQAPLANSTTPTDSPLYNMLSGSVGPNNVPEYVPVGALNWPTMPPGEPPGPVGQQVDELYLEFNSASPPQLVTAFGNWITNGKPDDTPQAAPFLALPGGPPQAFPGAQGAILFAASFPTDGDAHDPGPNYVPHNFWVTSPIALLNDQGKFPVPTPLTLGPNEEYYVCALVGNSGATGSAGRALHVNSLPMNVICDALCFGTFMSPAVPLPSFSNFDPTDTNPTYEQYALPPMSYDVVAFRFNVNTVFAGLAAGLRSRRRDARRLAAGGPSLRQGAGDRGRIRQPLPVRRQPRPHDRFQPGDRPPHRPAQPAALRHAGDGACPSDVDQLHRLAGRARAERTADPASRLAGRGNALLLRDPEPAFRALR